MLIEIVAIGQSNFLFSRIGVVISGEIKYADTQDSDRYLSGASEDLLPSWSGQIKLPNDIFVNYHINNIR